MRFALWTSAMLIVEAVNAEFFEQQTSYLILLAIAYGLWDVMEFIITHRKE